MVIKAPIQMDFFEKPILNSPYEYPSQHWVDELDSLPNLLTMQATLFINYPCAECKSETQEKRSDDDQMDMVLDAGDDLSSTEQEYNISGYINEIKN